MAQPSLPTLTQKISINKNAPCVSRAGGEWGSPGGAKEEENNKNTIYEVSPSPGSKITIKKEETRTKCETIANTQPSSLRAPNFSSLRASQSPAELGSALLRGGKEIIPVATRHRQGVSVGSASGGNVQHGISP